MAHFWTENVHSAIAGFFYSSERCQNDIKMIVGSYLLSEIWFLNTFDIVSTSFRQIEKMICITPKSFVRALYKILVLPLSQHQTLFYKKYFFFSVYLKFYIEIHHSFIHSYKSSVFSVNSLGRVIRNLL